MRRLRGYGGLGASTLLQKTPEVHQGEHAECGLAALAIAMGYHGVHVTMAQLRCRIGSTLYGTTLRQLRDIARSEGFAATAHRVEPDEMTQIGLPLIAHMRFIHFVVVEQVTGDRVHVNDPAGGPMVLERAEFARDFSGIVLSLKSHAEVHQGKPFRLARALAATLQPQAFSCLTAAAAAGLSGLLAVIALQYLLVGSFMAGGAAIALAIAFGTGAIWLAERVGHRLNQAAAEQVFRSLHTASNEHYLFAKPDRIRAPIQALRQLQQNDALKAALTLIYLLAALMGGLAHSVATLPVIVLSLCQIGVMIWASTRRGSGIERWNYPALTAHSVDATHLSDRDWYRIGQNGDRLFESLAGAQARGAAQYFKTANEKRRRDRPILALDLAKLAMPFLLIQSYGWHVFILSLALAACGSLLLRSFDLFSSLAPIRIALHRLGDLPAAAAHHAVPLSGSLTEPGLCMSDAGWRPGDGSPFILERISVSVPPGQVLVVHSLPGSGTTTFCRLASGILLPTHGNVRFNGTEITRVSPGSAILVDHHVSIINGTLHKNLAYGSAVPDERSIHAALALVELDAVIAERGGLSFALKPDQTRLSGGQLRRLMLARALCQSPRLLVLDEALDNVEPMLACRILQRLRQLDITTVLTTKNIELREAGDQFIALGEDIAR